jgi:hypothetical protein
MPSVGKMRHAAEEAELASIVKCKQAGQEQPTKQRTEYSYR